MFKGSVRPLIAALLLCSPAAGFAQVSKIAADPQKGFQWPYYLYRPAKVKQPALLMVEPNNSGRTDDDPAVHDALAQSLINSEIPWADDLGVPYLVPTFPRPDISGTYTHALDRNTILTTYPGLQRIDLQLIAMARDARARLAASGINVDPKFFMIGASASGSFVSRFVMLHPDVVKAASIGTPGFGPIVPIASFNGQTLPYPYGIADLEQLVGTKFDQQSFQNVPLQVWGGDADYNEDEYWTPHNPEVLIISPAFGGSGQIYTRWPKYEAAYVSVSPRGQFVIFPGLGHTWADWNYIKEFFERNRTEPFPAPLPKPRLYKLYFPHVASFGSWETEIALTNTAEVPVRGDLQAFRDDGSLLSQSISVTLPALGRKQVVVGSSFQNPQDIAYLAFVSDSGWVAGYTRFSQPGNRASLAAGTGTKQGWFTKMEKDGWTGIAFVNTETSDATVTLTACDENGSQVATKTLPLSPGRKSVGMVDQLFSADLKNAKYFKFKSDRNVLGFTVSGSADGLMLDGLHCLVNYIFVR